MVKELLKEFFRRREEWEELYKEKGVVEAEDMAWKILILTTLHNLLKILFPGEWGEVIREMESEKVSNITEEET